MKYLLWDGFGFNFFAKNQIKSNQLHAVSRTQQVRLREFSSPLFTPERKNENIYLNKYFVSSSGETITSLVYSESDFVPLRHDLPFL